jgi:5'-nucleotidase
MHILVTNDDGVHAPGLAALAAGLKKLGKVTVFAPDKNWSASGHVKTLHRPLRVWKTKLDDGSDAMTTDGAPSDCVGLVVLGLVDEKLDLVVSGINPLANLGHDVTYSGTVTAAMEAAIRGLPGLALSLNSDREHNRELDYRPAAEIGLQISRQVMEHRLPEGVLLNINVPDSPLKEIKGIKITQQGQRVYREVLIRREDPHGRDYYWIGGDSPTGVLDPGTDFHALEEGFVSITPLQLDLTAHNHRGVIEMMKLDISSFNLDQSAG